MKDWGSYSFVLSVNPTSLLLITKEGRAMAHGNKCSKQLYLCSKCLYFVPEKYLPPSFQRWSLILCEQFLGAQVWTPGPGAPTAPFKFDRCSEYRAVLKKSRHKGPNFYRYLCI